MLTWGPSWYHQKQYFSGVDHELSEEDRLMHYDVEVSGFPSAHAGHLILLGLKEDDYPGTTKIEEWPTWDMPVLKWGKSQDAITGFSHSGWGLQVRTDELPNYEMPGFDGIGANEYIVDVTSPDTIDFISTVDTTAVWELNIWYHTLNVGFRTRVSGETDFPCIYQAKVGLGRSYVKLDELSYRGWIEGVRAGAAYVSDGKSHLIDFEVNGNALGENGSEIAVGAGETVKVKLKAAAMLPEFPDPHFANLRYDEKPYWDVERARIQGRAKCRWRSSSTASRWRARRSRLTARCARWSLRCRSSARAGSRRGSCTRRTRTRSSWWRMASRSVRRGVARSGVWRR